MASQQARLTALINAVGADVKALQAADAAAGNFYIVLTASAPVPGGTPSGTLIVRTA